MRLESIQAPAGDGEILLLPSHDEELLGRNQKIFQRSGVAIGGLPIAQLRQLAHQEVLSLAECFHEQLGEAVVITNKPLLLAGHQPELFHPGVWLKNFSLNRLAKKNGLTPLNLIIDNDQVRKPWILVPQGQGNAMRVEAIAFENAPEGITWEDWEQSGGLGPFVDHFNSVFPKDLPCPLLSEFVSKVKMYLRENPNLGQAFSKARRELERAEGVSNLELPFSRVCQTEAFALFTIDLFSRADDFAHTHNRLLQGFRKTHGLRSRSHPVPELEIQDDWCETPFWTLPPGEQKRYRLGVRKVGEGRLEIFTLGKPWSCVINMDKPFSSWQSLSREGWRVRPRALSNTLFLRLCLAQAFIHGIGGAKYDRITDLLIKNFYQMEPPGFFTVTGTLRLFTPAEIGTLADPYAVKRLLRDCYWNPQRHLKGNNEEVVQFVRERLSLIEQAKPGCVKSFHLLRENLRKIQSLEREKMSSGEKELNEAIEKLKRQNQLISREFSFVLFSAERLREFLMRG